MANRQNKPNFQNSFFLSLAFEQAKVNIGSTKSNPSVGCVVEKNGAIVSSGRTSFNGRPHAEYNALNKNIFTWGGYGWAGPPPENLLKS